MIVRIRLKPFGTRIPEPQQTQTTAVASSTAEGHLPLFAPVEPDAGESLLRLNGHLAAYENPAPVNVTVNESAIPTPAQKQIFGS